MRRSLAALAVPVLAALCTVSLAGAASAAPPLPTGPCRAYSDVPHLDVGQSSHLVTTGTFSCDFASPLMSITVCIEEESSVGAEWWQRDCASLSQTVETTQVQETLLGSVPVYATYLRTHVYGYIGESIEPVAEWTTPPVFWFNCACYVG
jgi:hypothetical protein